MADVSIELLRIKQETEPDSELSRRLKSIYEASFPPCERDDFELLVDDIARGIQQLFVAWLADLPVGLAIVARLEGVDAYLLGYIAVDEQIRGQGIGKGLLEFLTQTLENAGDASGIIFEAESIEHGQPEESALRKRRIDFYQRNGAFLIEDVPDYRGPNLSGPGEVSYALMWIPLTEREGIPTGQRLRDLVYALLVQGYRLEADDPFVKAVLDDLI